MSRITLSAVVLCLFAVAEASATASASKGATTQLRTQVVAGGKDAALKGAALKQAAGSFVRSLAFTRRLRVCNAYPYTGAIDVFHGKDRISESPLAYKSCGEYTPSMTAGDKLVFKVDDASAGSFSVSELPNNDAVLVLVIYRHDTLSTAVAFESHVFANLINAQIAVLDTYRGVAKALPRIQDAGDAKTSRSEELRYDSVVAVNPGIYEVVLQAQDGEVKASQQLVALNRESYLVMRVGVEAADGQAYPQELMVYPHSDPKALMGAAFRGSGSWLTILAATLALARAALL